MIRSIEKKGKCLRSELESTTIGELIHEGLVGEINRQSLQMTFMYAAMTFEMIVESAETSAKTALQNVIDYYKSQGKRTIPISFDCSWSHVHNTQQASGEIIYDGKDVNGYSFKPVIAFHVVEKPPKIKKKDEKVKIIKEGNFDLSSRQMEHAILISILGKLTPVLEEYDMLINVTINGDVDSNKTLRNIGVVNQIFADLKHVK
ncbi:hypothetical protein C1645_738774 [Glomus cerebriforme]|uniref:Uncharacterized protein n=1 Tax=Glomus cerebriforme TaxID=658196 RepID=A0A397SX79_9GLOM|nr:hypothetical protein C1645_738774 [Glomus cerebriforme]